MVVSKKFSKTSYAAPRRENGRLASWWSVDLIDHTLICNYYTIRHDGSYDFMRDWTFQVSSKLAPNNTVQWQTEKPHWPVVSFVACHGLSHPLSLPVLV